MNDFSVIYKKIQTVETENGKEDRLSFTGNGDGLHISVTISGSTFNIQQLMHSLKLKVFGQELQIEVENKQQVLEE